MLIGICIGSFEEEEATYTHPLSCPSDILLPNREKDLTYRQVCIVIRSCDANSAPTLMRLAKSGVSNRVGAAVGFLEKERVQ